MVTRRQFNNYPEFSKSLSEETRGAKNVMGKERKEGGTSGGLGSIYKSRALLPFFNLQQAHKPRPLGPKKPKHTL